MTEIGHRALTSTLDGFPAGEPTSASVSQHTVIVQPNFEMVFLAADHMHALYQAFPFVELQQIERVSRVRLTLSALHDGLGLGWDMDRITTTLATLSQKELPQNVRYEMAQWASKFTALTRYIDREN